MNNCEVKILAIDDNQDNLISLKALLKDVFPKSLVFTCTTGEKGLYLASTEDPDIILLDILMPVMDGYEVCRRLKSDDNLSEIPVIFVTAIRNDKDSRILALESGAEAFLSKPIDKSELTAQIRAMLKIKEANIQKRDEKIRLASLVAEKTSELREAHLNTLKLLDDLRRENEARKIQEEKLIYLSYHDQLTKLYNRRYFEEALIKLDTEVNLPITIVIGDINGLKLINDSFGHDIGDKFLVKAGEIINKVCSSEHIIARHGGDEFVIILPKTNKIIAAQLIEGIKRLALCEKVGNVDLSISFGYDTKEKKDQRISEILANAENQMYKHKLYERSSMRSNTIDIIKNTLFEKSNRESHHSKRVSELCEAIATHMDFKKDDISQIRIAGLVHDIGKIGVDEKILNKSGRLSIDERNEIEKHPETGWRILSSSNEFSDLAQFILEHHERWDGNGYPNGLKGEKISVVARIITVADSYDAMTSERSYRKGISEDEAIIEIKRCSGTQFDPNIAKVFIEKVLGRNWN